MRLRVDDHLRHGRALAEVRLDLLPRDALRRLRGGIHPDDRSGPARDFFEHEADAKEERAADARRFAEGEEMHAALRVHIEEAAPLRHAAGVETTRLAASDDQRDFYVLIEPLRQLLDRGGLQRRLDQGHEQAETLLAEHARRPMSAPLPLPPAEQG